MSINPFSPKCLCDSETSRASGPCITNVLATRRKNFSQWHRSFQRKLLSHWLKFLRHVAITLVIQGPALWTALCAKWTLNYGCTAKVFQTVAVPLQWRANHISLKHIEADKICRHFAEDIFKCISLNGNIWISLKIWLQFVPKVRINNIPVLAQIMAWRRPGEKPLSEPMMV